MFEVDCKHWKSEFEAELEQVEQALVEAGEGAEMDAAFDGGEWSGRFWSEYAGQLYDRSIELEIILSSIDGREISLDRPIYEWEVELTFATRECEECGVVLSAKDWPVGTSCPVCHPYDDGDDEVQYYN